MLRSILTRFALPVLVLAVVATIVVMPFIDRLIAEIRSQDLLDRIHDLQRGCDDVVIDLRDREDGA